MTWWWVFIGVLGGVVLVAIAIEWHAQHTERRSIRRRFEHHE